MRKFSRARFGSVRCEELVIRWDRRCCGSRLLIGSPYSRVSVFCMFYLLYSCRSDVMLQGACVSGGENSVWDVRELKSWGRVHTSLGRDTVCDIVFGWSVS